MIYGVFILKAGQWALLGTYASLGSAQQEVDYLRDVAGAEAKIMKRSI